MQGSGCWFAVMSFPYETNAMLISVAIVPEDGGNERQYFSSVLHRRLLPTI
jgi:hypothetical protein